jgi:hypothetical protein
MSTIKGDELASMAVGMFNALSRTHNENIDQLSARGVSAASGALASYVALRVLFESFKPIAESVVEEDSWHVVNTIVRIMREQHDSSIKQSKITVQA